MAKSRGPTGTPARECFSPERDQTQREKGVADRPREHGPATGICGDGANATFICAPASAAAIPAVSREPITRPETFPERLLTYRETADALGVPYYKIQRGARAGLFPTYRVFNGRRLLRLSEVVAVINRTREGGDQ